MSRPPRPARQPDRYSDRVLDVCTASVADTPAIGAIALASGFEEGHDGADPGYVEHLLARGTVVLAKVDGRPVGFAAALEIAGVRMLADLFVDPAAQGHRAGRALLDAAFAGTSRRMTFSSHDPRAITLYGRAGMTARWPLLYLRGTASSTASSAVSPEHAAGIEAGWTGVDRSADYAYWCGRPNGRAVTVDGGVGAISDGTLRHAAVRPGADPDRVVRALLNDVRRLCLPSLHPAVPGLLRDGFVVEEFDLFMTTECDIPGGITGVYSPGLC